MIYYIYFIFELFYKVKFNLFVDKVFKKNWCFNWCKDEFWIFLIMVFSLFKELNWVRFV